MTGGKGFGMDRDCLKNAAVLVIAVLILAGAAIAQEKPPAFPRTPAVTSPEVLADGKVVFRIYAPKAETIELQASDIFGMEAKPPQFKKGENGVWEAAIGPVQPGAYRYIFMVNGVAAVDPRNPSSSESNNNVWSMVYIPGAAFMENAKVPHGAVAEINYYSTALGRHRRMHIYTPPGYEMDNIKYPVFYLLHGAMDCDDSWPTVGRAGFILDNLIAEKKAKPMIVVMPAGHTSAGFGAGGGMQSTVDEFSQDFSKDIVPYVESHYRTLKGVGNTAIAGLSMGGMQTLNIVFSDLKRFSYVGVFSSGIFGSGPSRPKNVPTGTEAKPAAPAPAPDWEKQHLAALDNPTLKKDVKLLWFSTGSEDFLVNTSKSSVEMLKKHGFSPVYKESGGGHTWANWRDYLNEFAPQLFK